MDKSDKGNGVHVLRDEYATIINAKGDILNRTISTTIAPYRVDATMSVSDERGRVIIVPMNKARLKTMLETVLSAMDQSR